MDIQFKHVIIPPNTTSEQFIELTKHLQGVTVTEDYLCEKLYMELESRNCSTTFWSLNSEYEAIIVVGYVGDDVVYLGEAIIWGDECKQNL